MRQERTVRRMCCWRALRGEAECRQHTGGTEHRDLRV